MTESGTGSLKTILNGADIDRSLTRIAFEIIEKNQGVADLVVLGIPTRGAELAKRIAHKISAQGIVVPYGIIDITMYRDDLHRQPTRAPSPSQIPGESVDGKNVVLIDDVLYSGRTVRAALDALNDFGRPLTVQLAVLIDRGHRQLPIRADYVGKNLPTAFEEKVRVLTAEHDGTDEVQIGGAR
ncbi:MAG: bifunctional pyr operon transcriptional regulator/uracil phosphoribosyltransferase PyrR [Varibaculum sp.]|nr:bifunctional pyr operon transcriptional regulator/uracil phosphoribosyltransferase PyrR [Varibaculum sp.]